MTKPKFEIGEEVILLSRHYPQYNGTYRVQGVIIGSEAAKRYNVIEVSDYYYDLGFSFELENWNDGPSGIMCNHYPERSLRKKHPPARDDNGEVVSYKQMIDNLKRVTV